jgi:alpha-L-rhamnosidase
VEVPDVGGGRDSTGWMDAPLICTHLTYQAYGDTRIIEERFDALERYMSWLKGRVDEPGGLKV